MSINKFHSISSVIGVLCAISVILKHDITGPCSDLTEPEGANVYPPYLIYITIVVEIDFNRKVFRLM